MPVPLAHPERGPGFISLSIHIKGGSVGKKGDSHTPQAAAAAEAFVHAVAPLGDISSRKMFGGHGIFEGGKMFALVDSKGLVYLKAGEANLGRFEAAGAAPHGKMPYYQIPDQILQETDQLLAWAQEAMQVSKS
jgi:DNA transformation protein